jgi:Agrobacterium tumefaciens protein Atu4866
MTDSKSSRCCSMLLPYVLVSIASHAIAQLPLNAKPAAQTRNNTTDDPNFYVGMWVTQDGYIRHELRPDGRYDEARGNRKSAYQGNYTLRGDHINYLDDTGFIADGKFTGGVLCHAGMVLYREQKAQVKP